MTGRAAHRAFTNLLPAPARNGAAVSPLSPRPAAPVGVSGSLGAFGAEIGAESATGPLRVLVTGSRAWADAAAIETALLDCWHDALQDGAPGIVVVHGTAGGADSIADRWARAREADGVGRDPYPADWDSCGPECRPGHRRRRKDDVEFCPTAGHRRNQVMVDAGAAVVLAFQVGDSTGTADAIRRAEAAGIPVRRWTP